MGLLGCFLSTSTNVSSLGSFLHKSSLAPGKYLLQPRLPPPSMFVSIYLLCLLCFVSLLSSSLCYVEFAFFFQLFSFVCFAPLDDTVLDNVDAPSDGVVLDVDEGHDCLSGIVVGGSSKS